MKALAVLLAALPLCWGSTTGGLRAYNRGDHQEAFRIWMADSAGGNRESQFHLGLLYRDGQGVGKDLAEARKWLARSAEAGCDAAQSELGRFFDYGWAGPADPVQARQWFEKSAAQGNRGAMNELGLLYFRGRGTPVDDAKAFDWFQQAAFSSKAAMFNLGLMYETGRGRPKNIMEAEAWYSLAAKKGEQGAAEKRDEMLSMLTLEEQGHARSREARLNWRRIFTDWWINGRYYVFLIRNILSFIYGVVLLSGYFAARYGWRRRHVPAETRLKFQESIGGRVRRGFLWYRPWGAMGWILHLFFFLVLSICTIAFMAMTTLPVDEGWVGLAVLLLLALWLSHWIAIHRDRTTFLKRRPITGAE